MNFFKRFIKPKINPIDQSILADEYVNNITAHFARIKPYNPEYQQFFVEYNVMNKILEFKNIASKNMMLSISDNSIHSVEFFFPPICYNIRTIAGSVDNARQSFMKQFDGYLNYAATFMLSNQFRACSVFVDTTFGIYNNKTWIQLGVIPHPDRAPFNEKLLPIDFLTDNEREIVGPIKSI
jgi:hypothetical protein